MEVLEAYDLTRSLRSAAMLCGVDHHTVARYVAAREAGLDPLGLAPPARGSLCDPFAAKVSEWIDRSQGRIRADVVHRKLEGLGYLGSERTTRRVVAALKAEWRRTSSRAYKPWIPEPGLWLQWDYGDGPVVAGRKTVLFCAWLAWSRFRVILALADRTLPSVIAAWDRCFRLVGGAPTYLLTDNEKTVTDRHVARLAVRNPKIVSAAVYYGVSVRTCVPGRSGVQRRQRGDGSGRQGRPGPHRREPLARLRDVRRAGGGVRGDDGAVQLPGPCRDPATPGRDAHRRARASASGAGRALHRRFRRVPDGVVVGDGRVRRGPLQRPLGVAGHPGLGPAGRRRGGHRGRQPRRGPGSGPPPAPAAGRGVDPRRALSAPPHRSAGPSGASDQPGRGGVPGSR